MMPEDDFAALCSDIEANGLREDIFTAIDPVDSEVKIADGRNRFNACLKIGKLPRYRQWDGKGDLLSIVVSLNLRRRHLTESQRAMVAGKLANISEGGRPAQPSANLPSLSQAAAADMLNISVRSVTSAVKVQKKGVPELAEKVHSGEISVSAAAEIAEMPKNRQKKIIKKGRDATKRIIGKIRERSLRQAARGRSVCVVCEPGTEDTDENFLAAIQFVRAQFPTHARYLADISSELAEGTLLEATRDNRDRILQAIGPDPDDAIEINDCRRAVGLSGEEFDHALTILLDYSLVDIFEQGGKTETARGARKKLLRRTAKSGKGSEDLKYELDEEEPPEIYTDFFDEHYAR